MENINFNKLLPEDLETIKNLVEKLLENIIGLRTTNTNYQVVKKSIVCPKCNRDYNIVKNGTKNKTQRYKCKDCNTYFSVSTKTLTNHLSLSYDRLLIFLQCLIDNNTIEETSSKVKISKRETYNLRIKIISTLKSFSLVKLHGVIQADEKYIRINLKGTRKNKMPRESHESGSQNRTSGISNDQVCVLMAIDSYDNIVAEIAGLGSISTDEVEEHLGNKIENNSILVTDGKTSYRKLSKKHNLNLKSIPTGKYSTKDGYNLGEINALMKELEDMLIKAHGLSTRHLQEYLDYFKCRKILKYTVEYLKRNKELYDYILIQNTNLKSRDICKRAMPVDITKHYNHNFK